MYPLGLRLECALTVMARCSSRAGRGGQRWGTGPGGSGTRRGHGPCRKSANGPVGGAFWKFASRLGWWVPPEQRFLQASPAWPVRMSPPPHRSSLCGETHALLPQPAASAQSEQFQGAYRSPQKTCIQGSLFILITLAVCDREPAVLGQTSAGNISARRGKSHIWNLGVHRLLATLKVLEPS